MTSGLIVRRSERFEISLPARVRVAAHHADMLNFVKGVTGPDRWLEVDVIDFATEGMGFVGDVYLPRNLDLEVEIMDFQDHQPTALLRCLMKIKRVQMTDRRPAYQTGCSFIDLDELAQGAIDALITRLRGLAERADDQQQGGDDARYL